MKRNLRPKEDVTEGAYKDESEFLKEKIEPFLEPMVIE